jgi:Flp pilus assembly protein TadG
MQLPRSTSRRRKTQRGAYLVETSLVIVVFLAMILFVFDMGRVLLAQQYVVARARAGARYAAVTSWNATSVKNYVCYNSTTAPSNGSTGLFGLTPSNVQVTQEGSGSPWGTSWDDRVEVTVSGISIFTTVPYLSNSFTARSVVVDVPVGSLGATN